MQCLDFVTFLWRTLMFSFSQVVSLVRLKLSCLQWTLAQISFSSVLLPLGPAALCLPHTCVVYDSEIHIEFKQNLGVHSLASSILVALIVWSLFPWFPWPERWLSFFGVWLQPPSAQSYRKEEIHTLCWLLAPGSESLHNLPITDQSPESSGSSFL